MGIEAEEFWTVPFKQEVVNEDGHQFAGMIISVDVRRGDRIRSKDNEAYREAVNWFEEREGDYNGPVLPDGRDAEDVIAKSEIHRSTAGEIYFSNIVFRIDHTRRSGSYNAWSRYHFPDPEEGPGYEPRVEERLRKLNIEEPL